MQPATTPQARCARSASLVASCSPRVATACRPALAPCRSKAAWTTPGRRHHSVLRAAAVATETLTGADLQQWKDCNALLQQLGFDEADADATLGKAFGWKGQGYWRKSKVQEVPSTEQVSAALDFLRGIGIDGDDLAKVVREFPEVVGCDVDKQLAVVVKTLQYTWKIQGPTLTKTLLRRPDVLGYNIDCYGDCAGECNRCWVRF